MSEPTLPPPPPRPFEAGPRGSPAGCGKPLLIGCGLLSVLLGLAAILFVVKAKSILAYAMTKLEAQVLDSLPAEVSEEERSRLEAAFAAAARRIESGRIDPARLQALQAELVAAAERAPRGKLTRADVAELQAELDRFAAAEPGAEAPGGVEADDREAAPAESAPAPGP
jgi:hypothetical protein